MPDGRLPNLPVEESTVPPPPPPIEDQREMFFPTKPFRFYPVDMGLAIGIAAALFMLFYVVVALAVNKLGLGSANLGFFEQLFPGFHLGNTIGTVFAGTLIGMIWSFGLGFLLGLLIGVVYNLRLKAYAESS
ncbi:MAG: hypothetical protein ACE5HO_14870 [bacterium]